jgi:hypothetical protein
MSFSCKPNDKSNYIISSVLHICFPALGGQTRGKQRIPNQFEKKMAGEHGVCGSHEAVVADGGFWEEANDA